MFLTVNDTDIQLYKQLGVFASNIGDFVVDACANIIEVPIAILMSTREMQVQTIFPINQISREPLFLAYNHLTSHYCNTTLKNLVDIREENTKGDCKLCYCIYV